MTDDKTAKLNGTQRALLEALLDTIIPPDAASGLPGAGELGVGDFIEEHVAETPELGGLLTQGLSKAETLIEEEGSGGLQTLSPDEREAVARKIEASDRDFFTTLVRLAYVGYYTNPVIPPHFGLPDHPPQPEGNDLPPDDPAELEKMLEPVRSRGRLYREC